MLDEMFCESFKSMNLKDDLYRGILAIWEAPLPLQQRAMNQCCTGEGDVMLCGESKAGKTTLSLFTALQIVDTKLFDVQCLILVETPSIGKEIMDSLRTIGSYFNILRLHLFDGDTSSRYDQAKLGTGVQIVVATTGRAKTLIEDKALSLDNLKILILDRCDEIVVKPARKNQLCHIFADVPRAARIIASVVKSSTVLNQLVKMNGRETMKQISAERGEESEESTTKSSSCPKVLDDDATKITPTNDVEVDFRVDMDESGKISDDSQVQVTTHQLKDTFNETVNSDEDKSTLVDGINNLLLTGDSHESHEALMVKTSDLSAS